MKIKEALKSTKELFEQNEVEGPKASAEFLLRQVLGVSRTYLMTHSEQKLTTFQERKFRSWVKRRAKHEPVWYITGKIEFYGQDLSVNQNVLIPRPETEVLMEKVIEENKGIKDKDIVDIGTGSGTIILTLANYLEGNNYFASDLSEKALAVAKKNAKNLGLKVKFKKGDLFGPWVGFKFDFIFANLPYVPHEEMSTLAYDLIHYEPRLALDGGVNGLEVYKRFFEELPSFVKPGAKIYCEIGAYQGSEIEKMAEKAFPKAKIEVMTDYAGHDRVVIIET